MPDRARRQFLAGTAGLGFALGFPRTSGAEARSSVFTPETFGARGDGRTNDSAAMAALAAAVTAAGGGTVRFRRTTYLVGGQTAAGDDEAPYAFEPAPLLDLRGCTVPLRLEGNGARLKCAAGLRYGAFRADGRPRTHKGAYIGPGLAAPYRYMIRIEGCSGPVEIGDLELDGSIGQLVIGGPYGDTGWQIPGTGLILIDNAGAEILRNVHTHHHGLDGLTIDGLDADLPEPPARRIEGLRSEYNGRQGCSIVGGRGYVFENCRFSHTGRSAVTSMPGAGVDIEAEGGKTNRDFRFVDCLFSDNAGCGMVADTGDSEGADFLRCSFIGTRSWSAWPAKPRFRFDQCTFAGALTRAYGDEDPARAAQFIDCILTDDPELSPTGRLYGGENPDRPLADLSDACNPLFSRVRFLARHEAVLPWSVHAVYADCTMVQQSPTHSFPRGTYLGRTVIDGAANLSGSRVRGEVVLNGRRYAGTRL